MNNYPPGMTREDWQRIDGERHYQDCPLHEEHEHYDSCCSYPQEPPSCICAEIDQDAKDDAAERKFEEKESYGQHIAG